MKSSRKFEKIWDALFSKAPQNFIENSTASKKTVLILKLIYILSNNNAFMERIVEVCIEKQNKDFLQLTLYTTTDPRVWLIL